MHFNVSMKTLVNRDLDLRVALEAIFRVVISKSIMITLNPVHPIHDFQPKSNYP